MHNENQPKLLNAFILAESHFIPDKLLTVFDEFYDLGGAPIPKHEIFAREMLMTHDAANIRFVLVGRPLEIQSADNFGYEKEILTFDFRNPTGKFETEIYFHPGFEISRVSCTPIRRIDLQNNPIYKISGVSFWDRMKAENRVRSLRSGPVLTNYIFVGCTASDPQNMVEYIGGVSVMKSN
jgi:hypothetical protein